MPVSGIGPQGNGFIFHAAPNHIQAYFTQFHASNTSVAAGFTELQGHLKTGTAGRAGYIF